MGETIDSEKYKDYRIIRTSWLFGSHGRNFVDTILALSHQMPRGPCSERSVGKADLYSRSGTKHPEIYRGEPGIYHITNNGSAAGMNLHSAFIPNAVPCSTAEFPRKAKRPAYSVLVNTKTTPLRHWREAVKEYIQDKEEY